MCLKIDVTGNLKIFEKNFGTKPALGLVPDRPTRPLLLGRGRWLVLGHHADAGPPPPAPFAAPAAVRRLVFCSASRSWTMPATGQATAAPYVISTPPLLLSRRN
jgi:hypothetical protein